VVLYLEILVDVDVDHRDDDERKKELDRARVHSEPASIIVKNRLFITSSIFPLNSYLLNMVLYNIEKGRQR
jgi:hypothetical protein